MLESLILSVMLTLEKHNMPTTVEINECCVYMTCSLAAAPHLHRLSAALDQVQPTVKGTLVSTGDWSTA